RDNGTLFPSPGLIPYQIMPGRLSGNSIWLDFTIGNFPEEPWNPVGRNFMTTQHPEPDRQGYFHLDRHEIRARVWRNGQELSARVRYAEFDATVGLLREFTIDLDDVLPEEQIEGVPTIAEQLEQEIP